MKTSDEIDFTNIEGNQIKIEDFKFEYNEYWDELNNTFWAISIYLNEPKRLAGYELDINSYNNIYIEFIELHFSKEKYNLLKEKFQTEEEVKTAFSKFQNLN